MSEEIRREASPLRQRMIEDMCMRKMQDRTQEAYIRGVRRLARFLGRSPEAATAEDLRRFQLHLVKAGVSPITLNATLTAVRFLFQVTLDRPEVVAKVRQVRVEQRLPVVLSREEVTRLIEAAGSLKYNTALSLAYGAGLRAGEVVALKTADVDSSRMTLRIEQAKGRKDRYAILSPLMLERLRAWWRYARPKQLVQPGGWLFPGQDRVSPMSTRQLNRAVHTAAQAAGIDKRVSMHTLRHCFATHLLEQKEDIRVIQVLLGHKKIDTTTVYTHVATEVLREVVSPIESARPS
jgi:site-specific recombinase XerD